MRFLRQNLGFRGGSPRPNSPRSLLGGWRNLIGVTRWTILLGTVLFTLAWWFNQAITASNTRLVRQSLQAIQSAGAASLERWLEQEVAGATAVVAKDSVQQNAAALIAEAKQDFQWDASDTAKSDRFESLRQTLDQWQSSQPDRFTDWCLCSTGRLVVASSRSDWVGQSLPFSDHLRQTLAAGNASYCLPLQSPPTRPPTGHESAIDHWLSGPVAPIQSSGQVVGWLLLICEPHRSFSDHFTHNWDDEEVSASLESYAFDQQARMLTRSRFDSQVRRSGEGLSFQETVPTDQQLHSGDQQIGVPWEIAVRDPGGDLLRGAQPTSSIAKRPLTLMAGQATRGFSSDKLNRYRNYLGADVIGVWQWLPNYQLGVATEIQWSEAMSPATTARRMGYWMAGVLSLVFLGATRFLAKRKGSSLAFPMNRQTLDLHQLGNYQVGEMIGRGGMGAVYLGSHQHLRRPVAIKVLSTDDLGSMSSNASSGHSIARFEREVQLTASLRHPNTIDVYDYGRSDDGTFFYVMEYVEGISLQQLVDFFGAQPPARVIHLLLQVCGSLSEAHALGLVHRDIKPANLLLSNQAGVHDWIKVLDFGLIKNMSSTADDLSLTQFDTVTGTPMYMSPECVRDASSSDPLSDLYSVGAVGYALLTGKPIFDGGGTVDICFKQLKEDPVRPEQRFGGALPEDLQNVLMSCLRKDPAERPRDMQDLVLALRSCNDALSWTEADATHWWEVVYAERASELEASRDSATQPVSANQRDLANQRDSAEPLGEGKRNTVNTRKP